MDRSDREILEICGLGFAVGIGLLGLAFTLTPPPIELLVGDHKVLIPAADPFWKFFLKELGFALVIAGFIGATIDQLTKKKHEAAADRLAARMNEKLFHAVLGNDVPPKLYAHVRDHALGANFYRTEFRVFFGLGTAGVDDANPDTDRYLRVSEQTQYRLRNISSETRTFRVQLAIDPVQFSPSEKVPQTKFEFIKVNGTPIEIHQGAGIGPLEIIADHAVDLAPGEEVEVDSSTITYMRTTDEQLFTCNYPTEGLRLTVCSYHPNITFYAQSLHPIPLKNIRDDKHMKEWKLDAAMMPKHGFVLNWYPSDLFAAGSAS